MKLDSDFFLKRLINFYSFISDGGQLWKCERTSLLRHGVRRSLQALPHSFTVSIYPINLVKKLLLLKEHKKKNNENLKKYMYTHWLECPLYTLQDCDQTS